MKKIAKKKLEKVFWVLGITIFVILFISIIFKFGFYLVNDYPAERAATKWAKTDETQEFCMSMMIDENKSVAYFHYNCKSWKVLRGIKDCNGQYYVFLNKLNNKWVVNESSKAVIW